jgi:hypothetical protein
MKCDETSLQVRVAGAVGVAVVTATAAATEAPWLRNNSWHKPMRFMRISPPPPRSEPSHRHYPLTVPTHSQCRSNASNTQIGPVNLATTNGLRLISTKIVQGKISSFAGVCCCIDICAQSDRHNVYWTKFVTNENLFVHMHKLLRACKCNQMGQEITNSYTTLHYDRGEAECNFNQTTR